MSTQHVNAWHECPSSLCNVACARREDTHRGVQDAIACAEVGVCTQLPAGFFLHAHTLRPVSTLLCKTEFRSSTLCT